MNFTEAKHLIIGLLQREGRVTNSRLVEALGGDKALFEQVREDLILNDLVEDKKGIGLMYSGPAMPDTAPAAETVSPEPEKTAEITPRRIFISYGRDDAGPLADHLAQDLEEQGHTVWIDTREVPPGVSWEAEIEQAILSHEVFLALLSPHAVRRPDGVCLDEISFARYQNRTIIPVMVVQCRPPLGIYRLDWIDFQDWQQPTRYQQALARLLTALAHGGNVEGRYANLFAVLRPLDFGAELARLTRDFTGRQWLLAELENWLQREDSRLFFINGDPGTGKSAVMAYLASRHPRVGAYHFCMSSLKDSLNPYTFVRSLTAQLATQWDQYRGALESLDLRQSAEDASDQLRRWVATCAVAPDGLTVVAVERSGRAHILRLENFIPGTPIITAWHSPEQGDEAFGCTHCRTWSEIPASALGTELPCPHCGKTVKLNPFTIEADWRPVAAAWQRRTGEEAD